MAVYAETVFIHSVNIVIFAHINPVGVVVKVGAPYEVVIPKILPASKVPGKESIDTKDCRREDYILLQQVFRLHGPALLEHVFPDQIPARLKSAEHKIFMEIPVLIVQARLSWRYQS